MKQLLWAKRAMHLIGLGNYPASLESLSEALKIAENPANEKSALPFLRGDTPHARRLYNLGLIELHMGTLYGVTGNSEMEKLRVLQSIGLCSIYSGYFFDFAWHTCT